MKHVLLLLMILMISVNGECLEKDKCLLSKSKGQLERGIGILMSSQCAGKIKDCMEAFKSGGCYTCDAATIKAKRKEILSQSFVKKKVCKKGKKKGKGGKDTELA